jgi:hypothetical protein
MSLRFFVVMLAMGMLGGAQACSPTVGWKPKTVSELAAAAPIVADIRIKSVSGDVNIQTAIADVKCVVKNTSGAPMPKQIRVTGFGSPSLCLSPAQAGTERIAYLDRVDPKSSPPTYKLVYSDQLAGTSPATPSTIAAAKSAVRASAVNANDVAC